MKIIHIVGRQKHGKTTLIEELIRFWRGRGVRVGTIKHTSHIHEFDQPGKDSHRHRVAGAEPVAIVGPEQSAIFLAVPNPSAPLAHVLTLFQDECDIVLIEGHIEGEWPKVEVWRASVEGSLPLALEHGDICALITDDDPPAALKIPAWPRAEIEATAKRIMDAASKMGS